MADSNWQRIAVGFGSATKRSLSSAAVDGEPEDQLRAPLEHLISGLASLGKDKVKDKGDMVHIARGDIHQLKNVGGTTLVTYSYDATYRRITEAPASGATIDLYYSASWQVVEDRQSTHSSIAYRQYVWSPVYIDAMVLRDRDTNADGTADERLYCLQDANYNVTSTVSTAGSVVERYRYDPYGLPAYLDAGFGTRATSSYDWAYLHQGGRYDTLFGTLYCFRNRDLHPTLGRWMEEDPMGYVDGASRYTLCDANPLRYLDPSGDKKIVIAMEGFVLGGPLSLSARFVKDDWKPIVDADPDAEWHYFNESEVTAAYEFAKKAAMTVVSRSRSGCAYHTMIIIGFSNGGQAAIEVARRLKKDNIQIDGALTSDPVVKALQSFTFSKPENVTTWINYYEHGDTHYNGRLQGNSVAGADTDKELKKDDFKEFVDNGWYPTALDAYHSSHFSGLMTKQSDVVKSLKGLLKSTGIYRGSYTTTK